MTENRDTKEINCPHCGSDGEVPKWWIGFKIECKNCDKQFRVFGSKSLQEP